MILPRTNSICSLVCCLVIMSDLNAKQISQDAPVSVESLVTEALSRNAELHSFSAEVKAMQGERTQAGLWKNPELELEYGERRVQEGNGSQKGKGYSHSIRLRQTFEFPGKGSLRKAVADRNVTLAILGLEQFQASLAGQVRLLALRYSLAGSEAELAHEITLRSSSLIDLLKKRPASGAQSLLEIRLLQAHLIDLQKTALDRKMELEETRLALNSLLGRPSSMPLVILPSSTAPVRPGPVNELIMSGLNHSRLLKIREAELDRAGSHTTAAWLEAAPDFSVAPFYSEEKAGDKEVTVGLSVSMPLPLWNWNQGSIESAKARREQAEALLMDARNKVEESIARHHRALLLSLDLLEKYPPETARELAESADLADRQYRTGATSIQLFLDVQKAALEGRHTLNQTLADAWSHHLDLTLLCGQGSKVPPPAKAQPHSGKEKAAAK